MKKIGISLLVVQIHYVIVNYLYVLLMGFGKHILEQLNLRINILIIALMQIVQSFLMSINLLNQFLDDRTAYWYTKGVFGFKIIESCIKGRFYDNEKMRFI